MSDVKKMRCPYCDHEFPMTWGRYLKAPLGRHICPSCSKKSQFNQTKRYLMWFQIPLGFLAAILTIVFLFILPTIWLAATLAFCVSWIVGMSIDRYVEVKLRQLRRLEEKKVSKRNSDVNP